MTLQAAKQEQCLSSHCHFSQCLYSISLVIVSLVTLSRHSLRAVTAPVTDRVARNETQIIVFISFVFLKIFFFFPYIQVEHVQMTLQAAMPEIELKYARKVDVWVSDMFLQHDLSPVRNTLQHTATR